MYAYAHVFLHTSAAACMPRSLGGGPRRKRRPPTRCLGRWQNAYMYVYICRYMYEQKLHIYVLYTYVYV